MTNMSKSEEMRDAFFQELAVTAANDDRIVFLTADHGAQSLDSFQSNFPKRFYNVGIAEQNMVSMAGGLASKGKLPVVYGIAPFVSLRALEQVTLDVASMNLPVTIVGIGPGFCYSTDGYTHHGLQDIGAMATVPNLSIYNSSDPASTKYFASNIGKDLRPKYVRIEKGQLTPLERQESDWQQNGFGTVRNGSNSALILTSGAITHEVLRSCEDLERQHGVSATVIDVHRLKPIPAPELVELISMHEQCLVVEENYCYLAKEIAFELSKRSMVGRLKSLSVPEEYFVKGGPRELMRSLGGVANAEITAWLQKQVLVDHKI